MFASRKGDSAKISNRTATPRVDTAMLSELQLVLEPARRELVRAFVREASLAEGVSVSVASLIADDTAQTWLALCTPGSGRDRARIALVCSHREVRTTILLHGHSRFSNVAASVAGDIRRDAGISCREHGIDGSLLGQGRERRACSGGGARQPGRGDRPCRTGARAWSAGGRTGRGRCAFGLPRPSSARTHDRAPLRGSAQARPARNLRRAAHDPYLLAA